MGNAEKIEKAKIQKENEQLKTVIQNLLGGNTEQLALEYKPQQLALEYGTDINQGTNVNESSVLNISTPPEMEDAMKKYMRRLMKNNNGQIMTTNNGPIVLENISDFKKFLPHFMNNDISKTHQLLHGDEDSNKPNFNLPQPN